MCTCPETLQAQGAGQGGLALQGSLVLRSCKGDRKHVPADYSIKQQVLRALRKALNPSTALPLPPYRKSLSLNIMSLPAPPPLSSIAAPASSASEVSRSVGIDLWLGIVSGESVPMSCAATSRQFCASSSAAK
jgi:hypothetical protein